MLSAAKKTHNEQEYTRLKTLKKWTMYQSHKHDSGYKAAAVKTILTELRGRAFFFSLAFVHSAPRQP